MCEWAKIGILGIMPELPNFDHQPRAACELADIETDELECNTQGGSLQESRIRDASLLSLFWKV